MRSQEKLDATALRVVQDGLHEITLPFDVQRQLWLIDQKQTGMSACKECIAQKKQQLPLTRGKKGRVQMLVRRTNDKAVIDIEGNSFVAVKGINGLDETI